MTEKRADYGRELASVITFNIRIEYVFFDRRTQKTGNGVYEFSDDYATSGDAGQAGIAALDTDCKKRNVSVLGYVLYVAAKI